MRDQQARTRDAEAACRRGVGLAKGLDWLAVGSNVHPREVEEVLLTHPGVAEVAVLGMPDPTWGEIGVAVIVRREGVPPVQTAELLAHLDGRCARYRWPRQVFYWDALPKSGYGKITKNEVRRLLVERGEVA